MKKILLSIAGFDPSSGAGLVLDLKVFQKLNFHGMGILTSLTVQNTKDVKKVHCISSDIIWNQYKALQEDVSFSGVKVGMLGCKSNIQVVNKILSENKDIPKVVDPVFKSSSGTWLLEKEAIHRCITKISGKASLLTPNREEANLISGIKIKNAEDMKEAAKQIFSLTNIPCLIKGFNIKSIVIDVLFDGKKFHQFENKKIKKKVHGTGCFLSSSILSFMAKGNSLEESCSLASKLTYQAMSKAIQLGQGQQIISFFLEED
ncbi:MAG: bifunctional hydroxymethylpyrimidine kinase/phosphomethylpyrimidine kinase [Candidatus Aminicenantaceae bacterium]